MTREEIEELKGLAASMGLYDDKNPCKRAVILGKAIQELEQEPTTKNNLGVDCISRAEVNQVIEDYMDEQYHVLSDRTRERAFGAKAVMARINELPSVTPQEPRWIPVSERLPEEHICDDGFHEPSKSVLVQMKSGAMHTARYWSRYDERWLDLNYPTTDEVIAWMPLPKPYELQESEG